MVVSLIVGAIHTLAGITSSRPEICIGPNLDAVSTQC
jgi:hypothetical protein